MSISEWINETFFGMDASIFRFTNEMLNENPFIFKIARFISYFGDHGIFFIALAVVLLVFRKTRKVGILLACGLAFNHVLNNMIIKNLVARARPYDEVLEFKLMWETHSNIKMNSYSFPSGHTSTAASFGVGLFIALNKKYSWLFLLFPLLMGWSRITLFVHYPSDVLFGIIIGTIAIVLAYFTSKLLFKLKIVENLTTGEKLF